LRRLTRWKGASPNTGYTKARFRRNYTDKLK
jgi:hypothetical protein